MSYTPMMLQYFEVKNKYEGYLLFYRLGDFYEMFFEDAIVASRELELTLTGRDCGMSERAPMCGVPFHAADTYIARLVKKGYKVAICEQLEDPQTATGIVKRDVIRIITPGTVTEGALLSDGKNNYLCSVYDNGKQVGMCVCDISTAETYATDFCDKDIYIRLLNELGIYCPSELIVNRQEKDLQSVFSFVKERVGGIAQTLQQDFFKGNAVQNVKAQFGTKVLSDNMIEDDSAVVYAINGLLQYLKETQKTDISYINNLNYYNNDRFMSIDLSTRRNLEICETLRNKEKKGTLLWVLDYTKTAMGARLLRKWCEQPLLSVPLIQRRQNAIKELCDNFMIKDEISDALCKVSDLERLMTKIVYNSANGKDLKSLEYTCAVLPLIKDCLNSFSCNELSDFYNSLDTLQDIGSLINSAIIDDPPFLIREGGFIKQGYSPEVDQLRSMMGEGKEWIARIEQTEREQTGIKNLKVGYNRVFGYYIEISKSFVSQAPERYIRKQTLANCERYITQELKDMESRVLGAQDKLVALEYELFQQIREVVAQNISRIQDAANILSKLDVYASLADAAKKNSFVCPEVDYSDKLEINDGRHPVVEIFTKGMFVPNDTNMDNASRLMLITGPNMAGKSTYMRQNALIIIMAQMGSFVPAKYARIGIVDKMFSRIGASDDLASGQSTFMLEMNEVAYILGNATSKSFIIYDEIGRGTSTFDGMSIARAVAEYTASKKCGAKTMFATHYHELCELADSCEGIVNYSIAAKKRADELIFLRKIVKGSADDSFGIEVALLAGVPGEVIKRAREILENLENNKAVPRNKKLKERQNYNEGMFTLDDLAENEVCKKLNKLDLDTLTPMEALTTLYELQKLAQQ